MDKRRNTKDKPKRQQKIVYKGVYISNQRRKGNGGRIKTDAFDCKVQVMDFNPALHESQIQWVQIRRYTRGERRQSNNKSTKNRFNHKNDRITNVNTNSSTKNGLNQDNKIKNQNKYKEKQLNAQLNLKKQKKISENLSDFVENQQKCLQNQVLIENKANQQVLQQKNQQKKNLNQRNNQIQDAQTQSQDDEDQIIKQSLSIKQVTIIKKQSKQPHKQGDIADQKQKPQQVIVARIIKETKIVFSDKKFVGIMTCQKKKNVKKSFIQKDLKPMDKILQDYFLDVTPIHSRLPKMQFDNLVKQNIEIVSQYIQKTYPQKGKQLTNKKLNQILDVIQSIYVVASFGAWDGNRPYANIHQIIGKTMTIDGQCNCFLYEHHLNDFTYEEPELKPTQTKKLQLSIGKYHKKFNKMVFSIDPASSVDLDDALSIQKVSQNQFQIGIHISDVSEYLKYIKRDQLMKRTTSVYLPHKVFHMLTYELMKICSLNPGEERLAFSVFLKMNLQGDIMGESRLQKNIIVSRFKLSYETVQDIISTKINFNDFIKKHPNTSVDEFDSLVEKLQILTKIGLAHRAKRIKFQVFENKEIHFQLDSHKWPIDISVESRFTSKKIVEQYMIIGNVQAAKFLIKNFKQNSLVIYHPKPSDLSIKNFNDTFKFLNIKFDFDDIHKLQLKFLEIENNKQIPRQIKDFMYFKGRRVQQAAGYKLYHQAAKQIIDKSGSKQDPTSIVIKNVHFALGQDFYTHFTSPMRRMADILVHESLNSLIYKTEPRLITNEEIDKINLGRRHTKRLKKDLTQMYMCLMIHKTGKIIQEQGIITSFGLKSVSIYIPFFDMMKQIIWNDELQIHKVSKNRQNQQLLDVCIYYDRRFPSNDIMWKVKKYDKVKLTLNCTKRPPLRLSISLEVTSTKNKIQKIQAINPDF